MGSFALGRHAKVARETHGSVGQEVWNPRTRKCVCPTIDGHPRQARRATHRNLLDTDWVRTLQIGWAALFSSASCLLRGIRRISTLRRKIEQLIEEFRKRLTSISAEKSYLLLRLSQISARFRRSPFCGSNEKQNETNPQCFNKMALLGDDSLQ